MNRSWIVAQIGAREHYALARALHQVDRLRALITDTWCPAPRALRTRAPQPLKPLLSRYHPGLQGAHVRHFTGGSLWFEAAARLQGRTGWDRMIARNDWFQRRAAPVLDQLLNEAQHPTTLFAYSYAARDLFVQAQTRDAFRVLGQIDAGPHEEALVAEEHARYPHLSAGTVRLPDAYWETWRAECALADTIVVNSAWSKKALIIAGVSGDRIAVVPLIYEPGYVRPQPRTYPSAFTHKRPLRVLFLGTYTLRKGLGRLLDAIDLLEGEPVEWIFVGSGPAAIPDRYLHHNQIVWKGRVPRTATVEEYRAADVFILPTISDGFALTQLEAQARGLPVIASERCGDVVRDKENGLRLRKVSPEAIAEAVHWCLDHPGQLAAMASAARTRVEQFYPQRVLPDLIQAVVPTTG